MTISDNIKSMLDMVNYMYKGLNISYSVSVKSDDYLVSKEFLDDRGCIVKKNIMEGNEVSIYLFLVGVLDSSSSILYLSKTNNNLVDRTLLC